MEDVRSQGRSVLVVSHSMPTVTRLCSRAVLLEAGRIQLDGPTHRVIDAYLTSGQGNYAQREWPDLLRAPGNDVARLPLSEFAARKGPFWKPWTSANRSALKWSMTSSKGDTFWSQIAISPMKRGLLSFGVATLTLGGRQRSASQDGM